MRPFLANAGFAALLLPAAASAGLPAETAVSAFDSAARHAAEERVYFTFEIRAGERAADFCTRAEVLTCDDLDRTEIDPGIFPGAAGRQRFEGVFVPGRYTKGVPARYAAYRSYVRDSILEFLLERAEARLASPDARENIILASIVQKEAVASGQFRSIASVFRNRLENRMPLGSCPTVEYALGYHRPFLTAEDISIDSPYNVYRNKGLPPTAIAFFSEEAWQAVQDTPRTSYTYFVYDWTTGQVYFSQSLAAHERLAQRARANYVRRHGPEALRRVYMDRFYE